VDNIFRNKSSNEDVRPVLERIIDYYSTNRPHASLDWLTPEEAQQRDGILKKHWKNKCYNKVVPIKKMRTFKTLIRVLLVVMMKDVFSCNWLIS
jgi:hypothetical protein